MKADTVKKVTGAGTGTPRGRGKYNPACDVCARKKTKCDGNKPVCEPCRVQGRDAECTWTKNPARKPRTEQHFEAMHKRAENLHRLLNEYRKYADHLESLLDQYPQDSQHPFRQAVDFRALRPSDVEGTTPASPEFDTVDDFDLTLDDLVGASAETVTDPTKEICIPTQSLKIEDGLTYHYGNTAPFRFNHSESLTQPSRFPALAENPKATYVLLVDDIPDDRYNPDFDWSRHLPTAVPLDRRSHDKALDLLFKFFTSWCLRVVPALFLRDMYRALSVPKSQPPPKTAHYSPMLHNALVALALAFLDEPRFRDLKARQYFANTAKSFIEAECQKPNLSVVHALSIIASFHSSQGDQTLGYMYFGMSARVSQALGLNVDCSEWVKLGLMEEPDRLDRHWTNWTTFTQDVCWSLYVGREFCVAAPDSDFSMPIVDKELDLMPWNHGPANIAPQPNYLTKTFEATCELLMISRRIMDVINALNRARSRPFIIDELISDIDLKLNTWRGSLAPELEITVKSRPTATPHKLMLHLAYWWLFILLHRPFFHRKARPIYSTDREIDHVKLCRRAAENIMELAGTWRSLYTLRYCPITLIQTIFSAGTVYLLTAMQASSGVRVAVKELRHSIDQQRLVMQYLQEIGKSWQCATNIAGIMRNLMDEQLKPLLDRKTITARAEGLQVPDTVEIDEDEDGPPATGISRSPSRGHSIPGHSRRRSSTSRMRQEHRVSHSRGQSSQTSLPPLTSSPTIMISPVHDPSSSSIPVSSNFTPSSSPITIRTHNRASSLSSFSSSPSGSWSLLQSGANGTAHLEASPVSASPSSSPVFSTALPPPSPSAASFVSRGFQGYPQPYAMSSTSSENEPLFDNGFSQSGFGHAFQDPGFMASNGPPAYLFAQSQPDNYQSKDLAGFLGMLGGQTIPQAPFFGPFTLGDGTVAPLTGQSPFHSGIYNAAAAGALIQSFAGTSITGQQQPLTDMESPMGGLEVDTNMDDFNASWDHFLARQPDGMQ